uniref:uncharacterized protein LOC120348537 n=1 Tax=Styela clava TaxID=7725 RepID=UPI00193A89C8|nr:uncharacterized protein LOC120348537 [Styela clava]
MACHWKIIALFIILSVFNCQAEVYKAATGDIDITANSETNKIIMEKGMKIIVSLTDVTLGSGASLKLRDGKSGEERLYKKFGWYIYRQNRNGSPTKAILPIVMETQTRKLIIIKKGAGTVVAHYTSFSDSSPTSCHKEDIHNTYSNELRVECDSDDLSPVASQCDVTLQCSDIYQQYSKNLTCENGHWEGMIQCQPKKNLLKKCSYDFDEYTEDERCPYSTAEVAHYYMDVEGVNVFEPGLGRAPSHKINCYRTCAHNARGERIVNCGNRNDKRQYMLCVICRIMYGCSSNVVVF